MFTVEAGELAVDERGEFGGIGEVLHGVADAAVVADDGPFLVHESAAFVDGHLDILVFDVLEAADLPVDGDEVEEDLAFERVFGVEGDSPALVEGVEAGLVLALEDGPGGVDGVGDGILGRLRLALGGLAALGLLAVEAAGGAAGLGWLAVLRVHFAGFPEESGVVFPKNLFYGQFCR